MKGELSSMACSSSVGQAARALSLSSSAHGATTTLPNDLAILG